MPLRTIVAVATYNELENLPSLVVQPRLHCIHREGKHGLGSATLTAARWALDHDYDVFITMDADWSHDPAYLPQLIEGIDHGPHGPLDVLIGSRYVPGGVVRGWPWTRRWMSLAVNRFARWWLGLQACDTSGAFRCYRTEWLAHTPLDEVRARGYAVFEELLWSLQAHGARIGEIPIVFVDRHRGRSKINWREALSSFSYLVRLPFRSPTPPAGLRSADRSPQMSPADHRRTAPRGDDG
jgi:dolichol-phosphate mannosyltransferase